MGTPPMDMSKFVEMQKNVHDMEEGLQILYRERGVIGQQVEALEFKMEQVKHFANFVTQWQEYFAGEVQGMARGTTNSIKQLEEMANSLSIAINSLHHVMEQQNEVARADHNAIHQNLRDLGFKLENNLGDKKNTGGHRVRR
jgi:hypothetical protein